MADNSHSTIYEGLKVELLNGSTDDERVIGGMSTITTVKSFRAVVAARVGRPPYEVRLMAYGQFLDDDFTLEQCDITDDTIITRVMTAPTVKKTPPPAKPAQNTVPSALKDKYPGRRLNNIFIKGLDGRSMTLRDIPLQMTASDFLEYAASEKGIDAMSMRLIFDGKQLHHRGDALLMDFGIQENSELRLVDRLRGG